MFECHWRILVVDDEVAICSLIKRYFEKHGATVHCVGSGEAMYEVLAGHGIDLILLDVHLPGKDGFVLLDELKRRHQVAVIMLTIHNELSDRLTGLNGGADDYVPKPFELSELLARSNAVLRRLRADTALNQPETGVHEFAGYRLDCGLRKLFDSAAQLVELSPAEFDLLLVFAKHPQTVLSRDFLLQQTRGRDASPYDRTIDVRVGQLRKKLHIHPADEPLFKTVRGGGYMLNSASLFAG